MNYLLLLLVFLPIAGAFPVYFLGKRSRDAQNFWAIILTAVCLFAAVLLFFWENGSVSLPGICVFGLNFALDGFRKVYALILCIAWLTTLFLSKEYFLHHENLSRYYFFNLLTLGATMGVFLSADLITAFVFFEIMSFTSFTWVIQEETAGAIRAANTYLAVAVIGGLVALMGLFLLSTVLGTTEISSLYSLAQSVPDKTTLYIAGGCILFGFGAKAGMFPLHIWLPKAHPVAPAPASALLSGVLTKSGIWGILAISCNIFRQDPAWGTVLLTLGAVTMVLGAVLAVFSIDLKRTLACSSMSQIGFILIGIGTMCFLGEENTLAARGTLLHMVNHSLFKLVLFSCAGVVYFHLHKLNLNDIRGFGRKKPLLLLSFLTGALGIGGIPGFSGYLSKTLLHEGLLEAAELYDGSWLLHGLEWLFLLSGGMTLAYMTKLFVVLFVEKHPEKQEQYDRQGAYMSRLTTASLLIPAVLIPVLGLLPNLLTDRIADLGADFFHSGELPHAVQYFSLENLKGAGISLAIGAAVYFVVIRRLLIKDGVYVDRWNKKLDLEELLYRPLLTRRLPGCLGPVAAFFGENKLTAFVFRCTLGLLGRMAELCAKNRLTKTLWNGTVALLGKLAELLGQNQVTGPIWKGTVFVADAASETAGNNRLTAICARGILALGQKISLGLNSMTDKLVLFFQRTLFRECSRPRDEE